MADRDKLSCIEYVPRWDMALLEEYKKLVKRTCKIEVPVADGSRGIKHLLNVNVEGFDAAATNLNLTGSELWKEYETTL